MTASCTVSVSFFLSGGEEEFRASREAVTGGGHPPSVSISVTSLLEFVADTDAGADVQPKLIDGT